jgi:cytochrome P450
MMISGIRSKLGIVFKLGSLLPLKSIQQALGLKQRLEIYGAQAIANHKEHVIENWQAGETSLFGRFLDPKKNMGLSDYEIADEALNLIVAGSDTTAVSLTYLVWALLRPQNASIQEKLLAEIAPLPLDATAADLNSLKYLKAVINETLRLYGAAPGSQPRVVPPQGATLGGYNFSGGTIVSTQAYSLHRDPDIYSDPET